MMEEPCLISYSKRSAIIHDITMRSWATTIPFTSLPTMTGGMGEMCKSHEVDCGLVKIVKWSPNGLP